MACFPDTTFMSPLMIELVELGVTSLRVGKSKLRLTTFEMGGERVGGAVEDAELLV